MAAKQKVFDAAMAWGESSADSPRERIVADLGLAMALLDWSHASLDEPLEYEDVK